MTAMQATSANQKHSIHFMLREALFTAGIALVLALPLAGLRTVDNAAGLSLDFRLTEVLLAAVMIFVGRLALLVAQIGQHLPVLVAAVCISLLATMLPFPNDFLRVIAISGSAIIAVIAVRDHLGSFTHNIGATAPSQAVCHFLRQHSRWFLPMILLAAFVLPFLPKFGRYEIDVATMVLSYVVLAWGLNIVVGYAGLLDLGYVAYYAIGAYAYALLAQNFGINFWMALPIAALLAVLVAVALGAPVLRLRGDYLAIVTLGFAEITRLILINWTELTDGPNGISGIPKPTLFGLEFARGSAEDAGAAVSTVASNHAPTFHEFFGMEFEPLQRVIFVYYIILLLAVVVAWLSWRLRKLPIGRAWEALRDNEIACTAVGISPTTAKLAAYAFGAMIAGLAGAFFATRQGFISPESFTFNESITVLAIVVLGGMGSQLGILLAAVFIIGMPELFRELEQYRMLAFGAGMVLIMIWRPGGLMANRVPSVKI
jgi:branched-chain amino acid transport system permease protein